MCNSIRIDEVYNKTNIVILSEKHLSLSIKILSWNKIRESAECFGNVFRILRYVSDMFESIFYLYALIIKISVEYIFRLHTRLSTAVGG